jgi:hypothetical protein
MMQKLTVRGAAIAWPQICACCLAPSTHTVTSVKTKRLFLGIATVTRSFTVKVPYCETCTTHVLWNESSGTPGVILWTTVVFMGCGFAGVILGSLLLTAFPRDSTVLPLILLALLSCGAPAVVAALYASKKLRGRPSGPLDASHARPKHAVEVADFNDKETTVIVHNDRYAALFSKANPG